MTLRELYNLARARFSAAGIDAPAFDAAALTELVFGVGRSALLLQGDRPADPKQEETFLALVTRREQREPLQYLLGAWEFMDMQLSTGPGVLCPREETELLCQTAAAALGGAPCIGLDLCAGTGAVALGLHRLCPQAVVTAVEISPDAAKYAKENIEKYGDGAVSLVMGDVLSSTFADELVEKPLDFILSNPPYIASRELPGLQAEVQKEPALALDGGEDGQVFYRAILTHWAPKLRPGGVLAVEIGEDQGEAVSGLFRAAGFSAQVEQDFAGLDRVVFGERMFEKFC